jgi:hypothetical protein
MIFLRAEIHIFSSRNTDMTPIDGRFRFSGNRPGIERKSSLFGGVGVLEVFIPKGFRRVAQGCRAAATLGEKASQYLTLKGFRNGNAALRNPFRVERIIGELAPG